MGIRNRVKRLEDEHHPEPEDEWEQEKRRRMTREGAEQINDQRRREGMEPAFEITESGDVLCTYDGRPVTNFHQTLAEDWYHRQLEWHRAGARGSFTHDPEAEAFYGPDGEIALSRDVCHLDRFFRYLG